MANDLRERIRDDMLEQYRRERGPIFACDAQTFDYAVNAAISVCEAMIREERERWGHIIGCYCHAQSPRGEEPASYDYTVYHPCRFSGAHTHPYHDLRCAPQEAPDAAPSK